MMREPKICQIVNGNMGRGGKSDFVLWLSRIEDILTLMTEPLPYLPVSMKLCEYCIRQEVAQSCQ